MTVDCTYVQSSIPVDHEAKAKCVLRLARQKLKAAKCAKGPEDMQKQLMAVQCLLHHAIADHCVGQYWPFKPVC